MSHHFRNKLSDILCTFRDRYSTQNALTKVTGKWKIPLDNSNVVGTVLMDLSQAYDSLPHGLLIAKLAADKFSADSLCLMHDYISNRYQWVRLALLEITSKKVTVHQRSILRSMLFLFSSVTCFSFTWVSKFAILKK